MHLSQFSKPSMAAERYVRAYVQRKAELGASAPTNPLLARPMHGLDFEFGDSIEVRNFDTTSRIAEAAALVGLLSRPQGTPLLRGSPEAFERNGEAWCNSQRKETMDRRCSITQFSGSQL